MEPVTLTTGRLLLRPLTTDDTQAVYEACQDPEIPRWTTVPSPYTHEDATEWVERTVPSGWREDTAYNLGVFTRAGGFLVGAMGLVRLKLHEPERQAELGYWTAKEHRGRGYTVEAGRAVCAWAFDELRVERLEWVAEAGNEGSRGVARKLGFVMEGTLRAKIVHAGTRRDAWTGSLLPSDAGRESQTPYLPLPPR
ncbi:GNAT family N-acetyltransferase [Streptomyces sp. RB6PN25]|uniref:GNAT family N-acetyltransferase n=1 Tax=Streptomyces humicola TaxID=2953240 RepID=A0ABT1Q4Q6_9ACTN|nr:GNAT family N-acetyltransferase [Streptomyces humicola]MCQ4084914.1 GNAT family N-acetyltransferase [Streptomyces humicola]